MVLDPVSLVALAAPFLAKGAEAFTKTAGEKLGGKVVELCQAVADKLKGDSYAELTLARAKEMPESEDRQSALKGILTEKMNSDSDFAEVIGKLLDEVQNGAASAKIVFDQRGQNVGTQTNIGNVHGSVNIGTK
ncbi:MAG: hypothetical protein PHS80_11545 [Methanothrix sp.]|nr:hypothetical protein [Methanothrix sp.]MDD4448439.1 hypothetical protein [Methanothrix sp.]